MNELAEKIGAEIREQGPISFARFMEMALYCPVYGYYEKEGDKIGRRGDFYTSVSVGPLFGQMLACQFHRWLTTPQSPALCHVAVAPCQREGQQRETTQCPKKTLALVEAGAHDGRLGADILAWLKQHGPEVYDELRYWIVEPSQRRRKAQEYTLSSFAPVVGWADSLEALEREESFQQATCAVIFMNELLDAMPVRRLAWDSADRRWFECGVDLKGDEFCWARLSPSTGEEQALASEFFPSAVQLRDVLPDGYIIEVCPEAARWWGRAAQALGRGWLVALDYGGNEEELLSPERSNGTLRAYHRHHLENPLARPGEQDLTAHVNFSAVQQAGRSAGLHTEQFITQGEFLIGVAARIWDKQVPFDKWTSTHTRQFLTLTHPEHLGRSFKVLIQGR